MCLRQETVFSTAHAVLEIKMTQLEVVNQTDGSSRAVGGIFVFVEPAFALSPGHDGVAHRTVAEVIMATQAHSVALEVTVFAVLSSFVFAVLVLHLSKPVGSPHGVATPRKPEIAS